jgi:hypothetical protein
VVENLSDLGREVADRKRLLEEGDVVLSRSFRTTNVRGATFVSLAGHSHISTFYEADALSCLTSSICSAT